MRDIKKEIDDAQACHPRKWGLQPPLTHATFLLTQGLVLTADYLRLTHYLCQAKCRRCDGAKRATLRGEVRELLNLQPATCSLQPTTYNLQPTTYNLQPTTKKKE